MNHSCNSASKVCQVILALVANFVVFTACEVGLGAAIDTEAPTVEITYPPATSVIRDTFVLAGNCNDDKLLDSVSINVTNTTTNTSYGTYTATLNESRTAWSVELNKYDATAYVATNGWYFPDGTYKVDVMAKDATGRESGIASRSFDVDNTAPVLIVSRPLANGADPDTVSTYGHTVQVAGDLSDNHDVLLFNMHFQRYDESTKQLVGEKRVIPVTDFSTLSSDNPLVIAKFYTKEEIQKASSSNKVLYQRLRDAYFEIYGNTAEDGYDAATDTYTNDTKDKIFYCGFELQDSAQYYKNPPDNTGRAAAPSYPTNTTSGNISTQYYINNTDNFYNKLLGSNSPYALTIKKLVNVINGTDTEYTDEQKTAVKEILNETGNTASSTELSVSSSSWFKLNPQNSPTFEIFERAITDSNNNGLDDDDYARYTTGEMLLIVQGGNDRASIKPRSVSIVLYKLNDAHDRDLAEEKSLVILNAGKWTDEDAFQTSYSFRIKDAIDAEAANTSDSTRRDFLNGFLEEDKYYVFRVYGEDRNSKALVPLNNGEYGFLFSSVDRPPVLTFYDIHHSSSVDTSEDRYFSLSQLRTGGIIFSGHADTGGYLLTSMKGEVLIKNTKDNTLQTLPDAVEFSYSATADPDWEAKIKPSIVIPPTFESDGNYRYTVSITAKNTKGNESNPISRSVYVDNEKPVVELRAISPTVTKSGDATVYVNGKISLDGISRDTSGSGVSEVKYKIWKQGEAEPAYDNAIATSGTTDAWMITDLDTTSFEDGNYIIAVVAKDAVGNMSDRTAEITIEQETDRPIITLSNAKETPNADENIFSIKTNNKLIATITDDDGVQEVSVGYKKAGSPDAFTETKVLENGSSPTYQMSYELPNTLAEDSYEIRIVVKDTKGDTTCSSVEKIFPIVIDNGSPKIRLIDTAPNILYDSSNGSMVTTLAFGKTYLAKTAFTLNGTITDSNIKSASWFVNSDALKTIDVTGTSPYAWQCGKSVDSATHIDDGTYVYTVTAEDHSGNVTSESITIIVDTTPPTDVKVTSPASDNTAVANPLTIEGTMKDAGSGNGLLEYAIIKEDGSTFKNGTLNANAVSGGLWKIENINLGADEGAFTLKVIAKDKLENAASEVRRTFAYDTAPPTVDETTVTVSGLSTNGGNEKKVAFTIEARDTNGIANLLIADSMEEGNATPALPAYTLDTVIENGESKTYKVYSWKEDGKVEYAVGSGGLSDGRHIFTITATDVAGKTAQIQRTVFVDTVAPTWYTEKTMGGITTYGNPYISTSGTEIDSTMWYNTTSLTVHALARDDNGSGVAKLQYSINSNVDWIDTGNNNFTVSTTEGLNDIYIRAVDAAENVAPHVLLKAYVDTTAPTLDSIDGTGITIGQSVQVSNDISFTFTASDAGSGMKDSAQVKVGATTITAAGVVDATGKTCTYSATIPKANLVSGAVNIVLTDKAGNMSVPLTAFSLQVDTEPPVVTINTPTDANSATPEIEMNGIISIVGTSTDNDAVSSVSLEWKKSTDSDSAWVAIGTVNGTYNWTVSDIDTTSAFGSIADGTRIELRAKAMDRAGNVGTSASTTITINQDTDRPVVKFTNIALSNTMSLANPIYLESNTLYGTISDDDGAINGSNVFFYKTDGSTSWIPISVTNSAWSLTLDDGAKNIRFRVIDNASGHFPKEDGSGAYPKLQDSATSVCTLTDKDTLNLNVNTTAPSLRNLSHEVYAYNPLTGESAWEAPSGIYGGKYYSKLRIKVDVFDETGIDTVSAHLEQGNALIGVAVSAAFTDIKDGDGYETWSHEKVGSEQGINLVGVPSGNAKVVVEITDKGGRKTQQSFDISVDNTPPTVDFISPTMNAKVNGGGAVTVNGSLNEQAALSLAITKTIVEPDSSEFTQWTASSSLSWYLYFDNDTENPARNHVANFNYYLIQLGVTTQEEITRTINPFDKVTPLYVWIKAIDAAGNENVVSRVLNVDPQGDRPTVTINYPEKDGEAVGGSVKIYGSAEDNEAVSSVWVQIISHMHNSAILSGTPTYGTLNIDSVNSKITVFELAADDLNYLKAAGYHVYNMRTYDESSPSASEWTGSLKSGEALSDYGILASFSGTSWNLKINTHTTPEFNPSTNSTNVVGIRVYAKDNKMNLSLAEERSFKFDADKPVISDLRLVQGSESITHNPAYHISQEYADDMWVRGEWYLIGKVKDTDTINMLTLGTDKLIENGSVKTGAWQTALYSDDSGTATSSAPSVVWFKYPLATGSSVGNIEFRIEAEDATNHTGEKTIRINYDNIAPTLVAETHPAFNISGDVTQQNGFYRLGSAVEESGGNQSGFNRLAFYFVRRHATNVTLYDIMQPRSSNTFNVASVTATTTGDIVYDSGLYWKKCTVIRDADNLNVLTLPAPDASIRKGGIMEIGGSVYLISSVSGTSVTIDGSPLLSAAEAKFALAQIVDHQTTESGSGAINSITGYYDIVLNDDGDGMVEEVTRNGTTWTWEAYVCSKHIPDGKIEIHYVAFDRAGNYSIGVVGNTGSYEGLKASGETVSYVNKNAFVKNNQPRIAGVQIGTDYDGDEMISGASEWLVAHAAQHISSMYYANQTEVNARTLQTSAEIGSASEPVLTLKGYSEVKPEIVGGNGSLAYSFVFGAFNGNSTVSLGSGSTDYSIGNLSKITIQTGDILRAVPSGEHSSLPLALKIWDSTETTTPFADSFHADITIHVAVSVADTTAPQAVINPFYWKSANENNLYENKTTNGHIELENDLPSAFVSTSGTMDKDPKVSGKIVITGTASDNKRLSELYLSVPGMEAVFNSAGLVKKDDASISYYRMDSFVAGSWAGTDKWNSHGFAFAVTESTFDKDGHNVTWAFSWDTTKITSVAAADVEVLVRAYDEGTPSYESRTDSASGFTKRSMDGSTYYKDTASYATKNNSAASTVQTTVDSPTSRYRMDVVPYITRVETWLSSFSKNNSSVYDRTAKGHYPIRSDETVNVYGFNLTNGVVKTVLSDGSIGTTPVSLVAEADYWKLPVASLNSGKIFVTVNGIESLNNKNNEDAHGAYIAVAADSDYTKYSNYYNRLPNGATNNLLTDDVVFDIWQINEKVAAVYDAGYLNEPVMKINPKNGEIGFAFANGSARFSMGDGADSSYKIWQRNYASYRNIAFAYDKNGETHGIAVGIDTYPDSSTNRGGRMTYVYSKWGAGNPNDMNGNYDGANALRIESIGVPAGEYNGVSYTDAVILEKRFESPSLVTTTHGTTPTVYLAYYDDINSQIRFRYGTNSAGTSKAAFNQFVDDKGSKRAGSHDYSVFEADTEDYSIVADAHKMHKAGEYVALAAINGNTPADDVVVMVWYDAENNRLVYSYKKNPCNDNDMDAGNGDGYWATPIVIREQAGEYCKVAVDANGGVHIAAYDIANTDLIYAHLPSYDADASALQMCTVDSYLLTGTNITLDVAISDGHVVPYIGYYTQAQTKAKMAYLPNLIPASSNPSFTLKAGVENDYFTGAWEVTIVPSASRLRDDHINIGVWKDDNGNIKASTTGIMTSSTSSGQCYGNGTNYPVLGYGMRDGTKGYIETAQMK